VYCETPEDAVRALERAYTDRNEDAAAAVKDFLEEARFMLKNINPQLASDAEILRQTADVLELSFRSELRTKGFPDFTNLKTSLIDKEEISSRLVKLTEQCIFPDGGKSIQDLFVVRSDRGWRLVNLPPKISNSSN
jgi:hypothetical protein